MGVAILSEGERPDPARFRLLVNTTAVGLGVDASSRHDGAELKALGIEADQLSERHVVVDLVYGPAETELIRAAKDRGAMAIDGLEILVRQGARSFRIWTGFDAPLATMTQAVRTPE
jgi:shikimate dehydrogenase